MVEMNFHILWQCPTALDVWSMCPIKFQKTSIVGSCFLEVVEELFQKCSLEEMRLFIGLARKLLMRRNDILHGGSFVPPTVIFNQANRALEEFKVAQAEGPTNLPSNVIGVLSRWKASNPGWVKINWDAALNSKENRQGGDVMIRDCAGNVLAARCFSHGGTSSPTVVESLATLVAIDLCRDKGFTHVHLEGDSKKPCRCCQW
jgi:hypothetical protein